MSPPKIGWVRHGALLLLLIGLCIRNIMIYIMTAKQQSVTFYSKVMVYFVFSLYVNIGVSFTVHLLITELNYI